MPNSLTKMSAAFSPITMAVFAVLAPTFLGTMLLQNIELLTTIEDVPQSTPETRYSRESGWGKVNNGYIQISQLQASQTMHTKSLINDAEAVSRRHLGSPQRVPRGRHILAQPVLDSGVVLGGVSDVIFHIANPSAITDIFDARSARVQGEPRVAGRDLAAVHLRAAHDLALFLVRPHVLLQIDVALV